nr:immunoglobulin heavy chain junction region [Macaca mulatta]MPO14391.1 immunoglobulin heavy chain junction region [Macaca mulatta]MPO14393.1 immunoglobulin heavy chain junction region [Macaca mulatta]MPO14398.1 immunoglobulin heavy chain junction region [Macaca mulatta]MPO14404.1 immunoglobulin heavy chain junction region [Macaca mulatta]
CARGGSGSWNLEYFEFW